MYHGASVVETLALAMVGPAGNKHQFCWFCESRVSHVVSSVGFIWVVISLNNICIYIYIYSCLIVFVATRHFRTSIQHIPLLRSGYRHINLTTATRKVTFLWHVEDDGTSETTNWGEIPKDPLKHSDVGKTTGDYVQDCIKRRST